MTEKIKMHKLTINIPEEVLKPVKRIALDNDTSITRIITAHLRQVAESGKVPASPVERLAQPRAEG